MTQTLTLFKKIWLYPVALLIGLTIAYLDFHATEVQGTVLLILISTFVLGLIQSKGAWLVALFIGSSILLFNLIASGFGLQPLEPIEPNVFATLIALIPAFIGAYAGAGGAYILKAVNR